MKVVGSLFLLIAFLLRSIGHRGRLAVAFCLSVLWFDILRIRRRVLLENLQIAYPEWSPRARAQLARRNIRHLLLVILEYSYFPTLSDADAQSMFEWVGLEKVKAALADGRGLFLLGSHLGNGDLSIAAFSRLGFPTVLISKLIHWKPLNDMWFGMRGRHGTRFIAPEKSSFEIMRALKKNEVVIFVLDQFMGPPVGCRTQFFGKETGTAMGLATLKLRTGAPVLMCWTERLADGRHRVSFEEVEGIVDNSPEADLSQNIQSLTQQYTTKIETAVRNCPEQWMWIHRRWKVFGW